MSNERQYSVQTSNLIQESACHDSLYFLRKKMVSLTTALVSSFVTQTLPRRPDTKTTKANGWTSRKPPLTTAHARNTAYHGNASFARSGRAIDNQCAAVPIITIVEAVGASALADRGARLPKSLAVV